MSELEHMLFEMTKNTSIFMVNSITDPRIPPNIRNEWIERIKDSEPLNLGNIMQQINNELKLLTVDTSVIH